MEYAKVKLTLKAPSSPTKREFEGHGSIFGNVDLGGDIVVAGAFTQSLADHRAKGTMPQMFWFHQPDKVPGKWLSMAEDDHGLRVQGVLAKTPLGDEMHELLGMEAVRGLSIGYQTKEYDRDREGNRLLKKVDLWEVSLVSMAMNPLARVTGMKARLSRHGEYVPTEREFEEKFREMGCSRTVARTCIAKLFDDVDPGGMPGSRWDAGIVEPEAAEVLSLAEKWMDRIGAAAISRRL